VVVVVQQDGLLNLYTWFPYSSPDNCADVKNVVLINQWVMEGEGKFVREESLYPYKIPSNFHGCTVNLSPVMKDGIEDEYYSLYFVTHNITRNYVNGFTDVTPYAEKILTCVHSLWARESEIVFGLLPLLEEGLSNAEHTFPYFALKINWFVPCRKPLSRLQSISHIFSPSIWAAIVIVLFLVTVASCCLAKQSNDIRSFTTMPSALYNIWAVTLGVSVTGMPRGLRLKFLFLVFVWYCSAISTIFQTFLTSVLVDPGYDNQLTSLDEILDSGIEFGYPVNLNLIFDTFSDLRHKEVLERGEKYSPPEKCIDKIRETGKYACFVPVQLVLNYFSRIHDRSSICLLNDDEYYFSFITTYVQKGSFFLESLNKFVTVSIESGIIDKTVRGSVFVSGSIRNDTDVSDGYFIFKLSHLHISFYILFLGYVVGFFLFLCEVFYHFRIR
jgi:hypothetical protein